MLDPILPDIDKRAALLLTNLSPNEALVLKFLILQLGNKRVPRSVPLIKIAKGCSLTYKQARLALDKLVRKDIIEKWSKIHQGSKGLGSFRRTVYLRLKLVSNQSKLL